MAGTERRCEVSARTGNAEIAERKFLPNTTNGAGGGVIDLSRTFHGTGIGPDVVTVAATRETMTKAIFWACYPRALLIVCIAYGALSRFERAVSGQVEG